MGSTLVWQVSGSPEVLDEADMRGLHYPGPRGRYVCLPLSEIPHPEWLDELTSKAVMRVRERVSHMAHWGEPVTTTWLELVR